MRRVYFYVNGMPRLLMAAVIASEIYPDAEKELILLDQFGYNYDGLLPHVQSKFIRVHRLTIAARKYSHSDQFLNCYFNPFTQIRGIFKPDSVVVLFGIRSPAQKFIVRHNKRLGNVVHVFAESLAVDRYFSRRTDAGPLRELVGRLFPRAFGFQHDYDVFYVFCRSMYRNSEHAVKIEQMFDLYGSDSFRYYAELLTAAADVDALSRYDTVFFGQPLSNFDDSLSREQEEALLQSIVGEQEVLVLPHPNERLGRDNKYDVLPNARVFRGDVTSDLLLARLRPKRTMTFSSTIGVTYALSNRESINHFYPLYRAQAVMLKRYAECVENMRVHDRFVISEDA